MDLHVVAVEIGLLVLKRRQPCCWGCPSRLGWYKENSTFFGGVDRCLILCSKSIPLKEARYAFVCTKSIVWFLCFSSEQRSWRTSWKKCHSVCIFFKYYALEKLFKNNLSLTLHPQMLPSFKVRFSLVSQLQNVIQASQGYRRQSQHCALGLPSWIWQVLKNLSRNWSAGSQHLPFLEPHLPSEGWGPAWNWFTAWKAVVYFPSCFINFSE